MTENINLTDALKKYFGFDTFKGNQEAIIRNLLAGNDTFVLMPTGGGKSLCYQLPSLIMDGTAIVISPLIALMKNQVDAMRNFSEEDGVAHFINSSLNKSAIDQVKSDILSGKTKLLYVAPESLTKEENVDFLKGVKISFYAVDEAHCISEWGHDFRPEYRRIRPIINEIGKAPVIALTATATPKVRMDIQKNLGMQDAQEFKSSFNRPNLYYEVRSKTNNIDRDIIKFIKANPGKSGIIYCLSRKKVEEFADILKANGIKALPYHAGMDSQQRSSNQDAFLMEKADVIVATIAFGMGIDKPDVRYVIHYDIPKSLEGYYQETGRAGRDGEDSECVLLYSPQDIMINKFFIEHREPNPDMDAEEQARLMILDKRRLNAMVDYCKTTGCLREYILKYFGERPDNPEGGRYNCHNCSNCVIDEAEREADEAYMYPGNRFSAPVSRNAAMVADRMKRSAAAAKSAYATPKSKKPEDALNDRGVMLFNRLRELRKQIAVSVGVPPYVIFSDRTLIDMCLKVPFNEEEMLSVSGVGENKYERYGKVFMDEIYDFLDGMKQNLAR